MESPAPHEYKMTDSTTTVRRPAGFDQLVEAYDGFIFDVWGTLYDGRAAYDGAVAVLRRLADRGKPVAILSNSPQRPEVVAGRLARIGIDDALYQTLVTSGRVSSKLVQTVFQICWTTPRSRRWTGSRTPTCC